MKPTLRPNFVLLTESEQFKHISAPLLFFLAGGGGGWGKRGGGHLVFGLWQNFIKCPFSGVCFFLIELCRSSLLMVLYSVFGFDRNVLRFIANFFGDFLSSFWYFFFYPNAPSPPFEKNGKVMECDEAGGGGGGVIPIMA